MSFRRRLTVAVFLILVVPIGAIALLLVRLSAESRTGKADARLGGALPAILNQYEGDLRSARTTAKVAGRDRGLAVQIDAGRGPALDAEVRRLAAALGLERLQVRVGKQMLADYSPGNPVANVAVEVTKPSGEKCTIVVSTTTATEFAGEARRVTDLPLVVSIDGRTAAAEGVNPGGFTVDGDVPRSEDADLPSGEYRARIVDLPDAVETVHAAVLGQQGSAVLSSGQALIGVLLAAFVLLALALIVPLLRDLERLHDRTASEAITDELTGLSNHRRFKSLISKEAERARRFDRPLSLLLLDLDDFKLINDTYGHLQGDHVLREIARLLVSESREVDEPARYGGEEFAIALPETGINGALEVAERIRQRLEKTEILLGGRSDRITVTASVGVAGTPDNVLDARLLLEAADEALYRAKREGKNRVARARGERVPHRVSS